MYSRRRGAQVAGVDSAADAAADAARDIVESQPVEDDPRLVRSSRGGVCISIPARLQSRQHGGMAVTAADNSMRDSCVEGTADGRLCTQLCERQHCAVAQVMGSQAEALPDSAFPDIPERPGTLSQPIEFDLNEQPDGCAATR